LTFSRSRSRLFC